MKPNEVKFIGNLVKDPQIFEGQDGAKFGRMRIAVNTKIRDLEETLYIDVKINDYAMRDIEYFDVKKGNRVFVSGRLVQEEYNDADGREIRVVVVRADNIFKIATKQAQEEGSDF